MNCQPYVSPAMAGCQTFIFHNGFTDWQESTDCNGETVYIVGFGNVAAGPFPATTTCPKIIVNPAFTDLAMQRDNCGNVTTLVGFIGAPFHAISLVTGPMYPDIANDVDAATPGYVQAAIAAIPADVFVVGLQGYNAATNTLTLIKSDGTTVDLPVSALIADAMAETLAALPLATGTVKGITALATAAEGLQPANEVDAATPAYVKSAIDAIPNDVTHPIANVPALTDAVDRGLSLGLVAIPYGPMTYAQQYQSNMDKVSPNALSFEAIFTNKAVTNNVQGLKNPSGRLGFAFSELQYSMEGGAPQSQFQNNAEFVRLDASNTTTRFLPAPKYAGQIVLIDRGTGGNGTIIIEASAGVGIFGKAGWRRGTMRVIGESLADPVNFPDNQYRVNRLGLRTGENVILVAESIANWFVVSTTQTRYNDIYITEENDGTLTYHMSRYIPSGGVAYPYTYPIPAINPTDVKFHDANVTAGATPQAIGAVQMLNRTSVGVSVAIDGAAGIEHNLTAYNVIPSVALFS